MVPNWKSSCTVSIRRCVSSRRLASDGLCCVLVVIKLKGYTSYGIGLCVASIVSGILRNEDLVLPVSTLVPKGLHGIQQPVYLSLPCVLNRGQTACLPVCLCCFTRSCRVC